tara:strand:- start:609 stop:773 length:165 start_codon:yes stop_codon:yes gene_type:complete
MISMILGFAGAVKVEAERISATAVSSGFVKAIVKRVGMTWLKGKPLKIAGLRRI